VNQQRFMSAFTHAAIGMAVVDTCGTILQANRALGSLVGDTERKLIGQPFVDLLHPGDVPLFCQLADGLAASQGSAFTLELRCLPREGPVQWVSIHGSHFQEGQDAHGAESCLIFQLHDITARHLAESRLHHIAFHDSLTDLANRHCFNEMLRGAIERSEARPDKRFAVVFLDLDRFKLVNDSLGHQAGNLMLREVADRLKSGVRPHDVVARLGGDEFAILLEDLTSQDQGIEMAQRALAAIGQPLTIHGTEVLPAGSMGITFSDLGYHSSEDVLRDADLAMYEAKSNGRNRVAVFDQVMHRRVAEKLSLEADLRHAIGEGQLSVDFQPMYKLDTFTLIGFEALARWTHPRRGPISPAVFIALAEESGHMGALTDWVIDRSVDMLARWQKSRPETANLVMHVNISGRDLGREGLVPAVEAALARHTPTFGTLTLEITETTLMGQKTSALQTMEELRRIGVRCSIDDFGTGYSSLAYLGSFPIDSLKIDRSFVMGLMDQPHNVEIVRAVLTLGNAMGRKVVAEGIETAEQLDILRQMGVPFGQGYLLSYPLRPGQVDPLIASNPPRRADAASSPRMQFN
jgi:diguanylate cyclase (GGDEF)-like protein/PAS domain S-box-containing protein